MNCFPYAINDIGLYRWNPFYSGNPKSFISDLPKTFPTPADDNTGLLRGDYHQASLRLEIDIFYFRLWRDNLINFFLHMLLVVQKRVSSPNLNPLFQVADNVPDCGLILEEEFFILDVDNNL